MDDSISLFYYLKPNKNIGCFQCRLVSKIRITFIEYLRKTTGACGGGFSPPSINRIKFVVAIYKERKPQ